MQQSCLPVDAAGLADAITATPQSLALFKALLWPAGLPLLLARGGEVLAVVRVAPDQTSPTDYRRVTVAHPDGRVEDIPAAQLIVGPDTESAA